MAGRIMQNFRSIERYSGLLLLGWLTLIGYLQASGITRLVEGAIGGAAPNRRQPAASRAHARRRATADAILERNPFDSASPPLRSSPISPEPIVSLLAGADTNPLSVPECDSAQVVIVTEAREPKWSVATLRLDTEPRPHNYRVGDRVADQLVEFIGYNPAQHTPSVWLSGAKGLCQTSMFGRRANPTPRQVAAPVAVAAEPPRKVALLSAVRVVPELSHGAVIGIRLFGIRPDSLLQMIGLQNGDRLQSINGFALGTPAQALSAYVQLRQSHRVALDIERRGRPITLDYRID